MPPPTQEVLRVEMTQALGEARKEGEREVNGRVYHCKNLGSRV